MDPDLKWIVGVSVTVALAWLSILVGGFWKVMGIIKRVETDMKASDEALHGRINRVREDTVHKSDLHELGGRLSESMKELRDENRNATKATNDRLDALLSAIANRNNSHNQ